MTIAIETKDTVGNLLQEWLKAWMKKESVEFEENPNSQVFPDFYLDKSNKKSGLLEIKTLAIRINENTECYTIMPSSNLLYFDYFAA